jgi:hypothetical protein
MASDRSGSPHRAVSAGSVCLLSARQKGRVLPRFCGGAMVESWRLVLECMCVCTSRTDASSEAARALHICDALGRSRGPRGNKCIRFRQTHQARPGVVATCTPDTGCRKECRPAARACCSCRRGASGRSYVHTKTCEDTPKSRNQDKNPGRTRPRAGLCTRAACRVSSPVVEWRHPAASYEYALDATPSLLRSLKVLTSRHVPPRLGVWSHGATVRHTLYSTLAMLLLQHLQLWLPSCLSTSVWELSCQGLASVRADCQMTCMLHCSPRSVIRLNKPMY